MKERSGPPVILNVDDDAAGRYVVNRQLKKAGFETIDAENGEEGLRLAESYRPDLILLDVRLPDIDGFEVCRRIRANPQISGIPVLQMSASYRDMESQVRGLENGADGYLTEPTEPAFLTATINSLLRMKKAEERVGIAARQWKTTFDAVQDGFAFLGLNGRVLQANNAYTGIAQSDPDRLSSIVQGLLDRLLSTEERVLAEETLGDRVLSIAMDRVLDDSNELSGAVCTLADVTARKLFESQLQQTQKLESIGVLAGGIAHDFNNLLTGILGNASLLLEMVPKTDEAHSLASEIVKASESAALLTNQILAYSGKGKFVVTPVDLSEAVLESQPLIRSFIPKNVQLNCEFESDLPPINADPSQLQQVIMNLIINAAESFGDRNDGSITVRTSRKLLDQSFFQPGDGALKPGWYVLLSVADNGSGMDEATQSRVFEPFFTTKFQGRGLGLSAAHGIMAGHKGVLRLMSAPGRGTTFELYFPEGMSKATVPAGREEGGSRRGSATVLVIDDESAVRDFAALALTKRGYRVLTAADGKAGVELFRAHREEIGVVLLDLTMPTMNGEGALEQIRAAAPSVPVILSSGFTERIAGERFKGKMLAGFLAKPYTASQILKKIEKVLARGAGPSL